MSEATFTGKFLKPVETFVVQRFDATDLNRLAPEILLWIIGLAVAALLLHFLFQVLPTVRARKGRK